LSAQYWARLLKKVLCRYQYQQILANTQYPNTGIVRTLLRSILWTTLSHRQMLPVVRGFILSAAIKWLSHCWHCCYKCGCCVFLLVWWLGTHCLTTSGAPNSELQHLLISTEYISCLFVCCIPGHMVHWRHLTSASYKYTARHDLSVWFVSNCLKRLHQVEL